MKKIIKISLIIAFLGIWLLLLLSNILEPNMIKIENITNKSIGIDVRVVGNITRVTNLDGFQIMTLKDQTGEITMIANSKEELENIDNVLVIGIIQEYNSTLQISADKIIQLDQ